MNDWRSFDSVADTYERVVAPQHESPARDLVALVAPPPGGRVLDVGTGTGIAAASAAEAVGPHGRVVGIDPSVEMLRLARRRLPRVAAAQALDLPFRDTTFDAVLASFVIFFFTRYETALFDVMRVLRPGGRFGATTWGAGEDEFRRTWREVAESFVGKDLLRDALSRVAPWAERFSDPARLKEALRDAGLRSIRVEHRDYRVTLTLADYLADRETSGMARFMRQALGDALWERFRERVAEEFRARFPDPIGDTNDVLIVVGTKP